MAAYHPPTADRAGKLRLDFNENTIGCSSKVVEFLKSRLDESRLAVYPEYVEAKRDAGTFRQPMLERREEMFIDGHGRQAAFGAFDELFSAWLAIPPDVADGTLLRPSALLPGMQPIAFRVRRA